MDINSEILQPLYHINAAPSAAPQSVRGTVSDRDVSLRWSPVNCLDQNGNIEQYTVRYRTMGGLETVTNVTSTMYTITGLTFGQQYSIEVAAANSEGLGAFSQPLIITLGQRELTLLGWNHHLLT